MVVDFASIGTSPLLPSQSLGRLDLLWEK